MELLGDTGHVESRFGLFGYGVSVGVRQEHGLRQMYHDSEKSFWTHPMELLRDVGHVKCRFDPFGDGVSVGAR